MTHTVLRLVLLFAALLAAPLPALADERGDLLRDARAHFARGECAAAEVLFTRLLDAHASPATACTLRWNVATTQRCQGRLAEAHRSASACASGPPSECSALCAAMVADLRSPDAPPPSPVAAPASPPATAVAPAVAPVSRSPSIQLAVERRSPGTLAASLVLGSAGVAALAVAATFGAFYLDALGACDVRNDRAVCPDQRSLERAREAPLLATAANLSLGVGAVAVASGVIVWIAGSRAPPVTASVTPDGRIVLSGEF